MTYPNYSYRRAGLLLLAVWALVVGLAGSARTDAAAPPPQEANVVGASPGAGGQMAPTAPVTEVVESFSRMSLALVAVPDPRVPRHRRGYDLMVTALIKGMLDQGYVLDRYGFPWQQVLDGEGAGNKHRQRTDCQFGVMLFRKDDWRGSADAPKKQTPSVSFRALYLIPETATEGLAMGSMLAAMEHVRNQRHNDQGTLFRATICAVGENEGKKRAVPDSGQAAAEREKNKNENSTDPEAVSGNESNDQAVSNAKQFEDQQVRASYATHARCRQNESAKNRVLLIGPRFSGSLSSLAQIVTRARGGDRRNKTKIVIDHPMPGICAVSVSATAASNSEIVRWEKDDLEYHPLTQSDEAKLAEIWRLAGRISAQGNDDIAIFSEASSFGYEICGGQKQKSTASAEMVEDAKSLCRIANLIVFPSNIADIRYERYHARLREEKEGFRGVDQKGEYISLDSDGRNSSEYPDSQQSSMTAAGNELELKRSLRLLQEIRPKIIVVAATDIRDRMFLFELLRDQVGNAQLIDMEADILLSHPQSLHASRGAIAIGSEQLTLYKGREDAKDADGSQAAGKQFEFASTDYQNLLRSAISGFDLRNSPKWEARFRPDWDCNFGGPESPVLHVVGREGLRALACPEPDERRRIVLFVPLMAALGVLCLALSTPAGVVLLNRIRRRATPVRSELQRRLASCGEMSINASFPGIVFGVSLLMLAAVFSGSNDLIVVSVPTLLIYCWALSYQAGVYRYAGVSGDAVSKRWWLLDAWHQLMWAALGLLLCCLLLSIHAYRSEDSALSVALTQLGYSVVNGMAIPVALVVAILAMVFADSSLTTAAAVSQRNRRAICQGLSLGDAPGQSAIFAKSFDVGIVPKTALMMIGLMALVVCAVIAWPLKSNVYGDLAAAMAFFAIIVLTLLALSFLANAVQMKKRVLYAAFAVHAVAMQKARGLRAAAAPAPTAGTRTKEPEAIGLWPDPDGLRVRFAATPAVARVPDAGQKNMELLRDSDKQRLIEAVAGLKPKLGRDGEPIEVRTRIALYLIFASEVSQVRWATFSSAICSLAVAAFAYCFPVTGSDWFVLLNVLILAAAGLFAGHSATELERNEVLSNLLCNRGAKLEVNSSLFRYVAFPFVLLAVMLAIMSVPGVMSWGDGIFKALLNLVGGGGLLG